MWAFDDSRLEDSTTLAAKNEALRYLAGTGARIRTETSAARTCSIELGMRPRGVVVLGREAHLVRAILEATGQVPVEAWSFSGLPAWVGPLDLVLGLNTADLDKNLDSSLIEATRRGAMVIVAARLGTSTAELVAGSPSALLVPNETNDSLAVNIALLSVLHSLGLGLEFSAETAADSADLVAERSSPFVDLANNPAKELALELADSDPLVWGASRLATHAAKLVAAALRRKCGCLALAAETADLLAVMDDIPPRNTFADPFYDETPTRRPILLILDDLDPTPEFSFDQDRLVAAARARDVRVCLISADQTPVKSPIDRYVSLGQQGLFGVEYLRIGLGRS